MYNKSKTRIFETKKETINDKFSEYYLYLNNVIKFSDGLLNLYKNTQLNTKEIDSNALKEKLRVLGFSENDIKIETNLLEISNELKENIQGILKELPCNNSNNFKIETDIINWLQTTSAMKSSTDLLKQAEKLELEGIKQAEKLELEGIIPTDTKPPISVTEPSSNTPIVSNLTDDPTSKKETTSSQTSVVAETTKDSNMPTIQRPKKEMIDPLASIKDPLASIKDKAAKEVKTHTDEIDKQMESLKYRREKEEDIRISNAKDEKRIELFKDRKAKEEGRLAKEED